MIHELKSHSEYFEALWDRKRLFDVRANDRHFSIGDHLRLREYWPTKQEYSGREITARISYILKDGCQALPSLGDVVILSLTAMNNEDWS